MKHVIAAIIFISFSFVLNGCGAMALNALVKSEVSKITDYLLEGGGNWKFDKSIHYDLLIQNRIILDTIVLDTAYFQISTYKFNDDKGDDIFRSGFRMLEDSTVENYEWVVAEYGENRFRLEIYFPTGALQTTSEKNVILVWNNNQFRLVQEASSLTTYDFYHHYWSRNN